MNISPKLQMNLHPKDADNLSLVTALNVKLANDEGCITNEESIKENTFIHNYLTEFYKDSDGTYHEFTIVAIIPCNIELVIIAIRNDKSINAQIFRYREAIMYNQESMKCVYGENDTNYLVYHGGKIKGAFTYNVENSLIIAIAEYDGEEEKIPLRTINLGNYDDDTVHDDTGLSNSKLSVSPEVRIPSMNNISYISGNAYKGWYYIFIRFKINFVDYTQWYNFGYPIYVDTLEKFNIIKYCFNRDTRYTTGLWTSILYPKNPDCGYTAGCSDYFSNTSNIAKETFKFNMAFNNAVSFDKYQIGIICASKSATRAFRSADIIKKSSNESFTLNISSLIEASAEEFIIDNYNYFDVKNIINYKNRLYISNYKENNANDDTISRDIIDDIEVRMVNSTLATNELIYELAIVNKDNIQSNQYDSYSPGRIAFTDFFHCSADTSFTVTNGSTVITDTADKFFFTNIYSRNQDGDVQYDTAFGFLVVCHYVYRTMGLYTFENVGDGNNYSIHNNDDPNAQDYTFEETATAIQRGRPYINPNINFNRRKLQGTLIPGEIYNFFIHFVDKYGHCTNGYRISNKYTWTARSKTDIVPVKFYSKSRGSYVYAAFDIDTNVSIGSTLNVPNDVRIYSSMKSFSLVNDVTSDTLKAEFIDYFDTFASDKYSDVKWFQVALPVNVLMPYVNNNGDRLFRVPYGDDSGITNSNIDGSYRVSTDWRYIVYPQFSNIKIPDGYVGFFISYEKYEPTLRYTGLLTRNDFRNQDYINNEGDVVLDTANTKKSDYINFYCGQFDISDSIRLDYNVLRLEGENIFKKDDIPEYDYMQISHAFNYPHDMNKPQNTAAKLMRSYGIDDYKLAVADSSTDNRIGVGTCMKIKDIYNIFPIYDPSNTENNKIKIFRVSLCNYSRDIYMSNNKTLIRLTNIVYATNNNPNTTYSVSANYGLPGHITNDGFLIYENSGYSHNSADNIVRRYNLNSKYYPTSIPESTYHTFQNDVPFTAYVQMPVYSDKFFESKSFKNEPTGVVYFTKQDTSNLDRGNENNRFWGGCLVSPANSIDLFENRQDSADTFYTKTFTNYREDLVSVDNYEKTIRRSAVIQDETRENGWRTFPIEAYKNITENKGIITNIIGIGTMLLVHTEHSLFAFDTNNTLETNDKSVQLSQPDAFEVNYKEVFTSSLGYGGLQDDKSFVIDQFGYIFYNNDFHRFYNFDNGQLATIDDDIIQWLDKYKPYNVRFANDKFNNRILIKMNYKVNNNEKDVVISYNYNTKNFVSLHEYYFDEAFNTKSNLYMKCNNTYHNNCSLHQFVQNGSSYGSFDNIKTKVRTATICSSKIGIIVNEQYNNVKFLEHISYKLNKFANPTEIDYTYSPVEEMITPYSADLLKIYNNEVNTGELDILINKEDTKNVFCNYTKPYWELGMWNYNYFRNNIANYNTYGGAFNMSRIFGNYFVIEFTFSNTDNLKVEFEELKYNIVK